MMSSDFIGMEQDFSGKYLDTNPISVFLVNNYYSGLKRIIERIPEGEVRSVLEVGCGSGFSTQRIRAILPQNIALEASEYLPAQVEEAKKINPGIKVVTEDVYSLDRLSSDFDMICLLQVLEHLKYPAEALKELSRVTKKYLIVGVPREPIWRMLNVVRFKYLASFGNTTGHVHHWSSKGIQRFIEEHFGRVVAVENPLPWTLVMARKE